MMKVLIVDDEPLARERLAAQITQFNDFEVADTLENGKQALEYIESHQPEIVLLDIRMPVMDGIEAARHLAEFENPPAVIFTTAYDEHALEAFENNATDYLLKPIRKERLASALAKANRLNRAQLAEQARTDTPLSKSRTHICARERGDLSLIPIEDIYYFHADQKYITVVHKLGEVLIEESLKSLEAEFGDRLMRIHRATLVAVKYIKGIEKGADGLSLLQIAGSDEGLEISRRHLPGLRKWLKTI